MAKQVKKSKAEIATIDCSLVTIETADGEFGFDTANQIQVDPQIEEQEAVKLIIKGILRAQKPAVKTITGNEITLSDNVFNPELVLVLQGGTIIYDPENPEEIVGYDPPVAGSSEKGETFRLNAYTAQYNAAGQITQFERISYPNCQGSPIAFGSEDGVFRAPEYVIVSAPNIGEAPYRLTYVNALPVLVDEYVLGDLVVTSIEGQEIGKTLITVTPQKDEYTNTYKYKTSQSEITLPIYGTVPSGYLNWNGETEIAAETGHYIAVVECDKGGKALAGGTTTIISQA